MTYSIHKCTEVPFFLNYFPSAREGRCPDRAGDSQGEAGEGEDECEDHLGGEGHEQQGIREALGEV